MTLMENHFRRYADYFTDEQLKDARAILLRNKVHREEKPSSLPSQASYQWCSTSLNYYTDMDSNYQKVTREDIVRYIKKYIAGQPMVAGLIISPDMNKQVNANSFFAAK